MQKAMEKDNFTRARFIRNGLGEALGITILTVGSSGEILGGIDPTLEACRMIRSSPRGSMMCCEENILLAKKTRIVKDCRGRCFSKMTVPVKQGQEQKGLLIACGMKPFFSSKSKEDQWVEDMVGRAHDLGLDRRAFRESLDRIPTADDDFLGKIEPVLTGLSSVLAGLEYFQIRGGHGAGKDSSSGGSGVENPGMRDLAYRLFEEEHIERLIVRSISDGIVVVDASNRYRIINPRAELYLNVKERDVIGKDAFDNLEVILFRNKVENPGAWREQTRSECQDSLGETTSFIKIVKPRNRILKRLSIPLRSEGDRKFGRLIIFHDVTRYQHVDQVRENLISMVSHELRTPLTTIKGALNILEGGRSGSDKDELLRIASRNCGRLVGMLDNIFDVTRFQYGKLGLTKERIDLDELINSALENILESAVDERVTIQGPSEAVSCYIKADRLRMEQVLVNFLENAVRYSPQESIVRVTTEFFAKNDLHETKAEQELRLFEEMKGESCWVRVAVTDQGPGIPSDDLERIFEPFYQSDMSLTRKGGGLGLGLTLCRAIIEEHGGHVWCESQTGQGSRFVFEMPSEEKVVFERAGHGKSPLRKGAAQRNMILVVDDDQDLVEIISATLRRSGYHPLKAYSGMEALSMVKEHSVRAIILDIRMPEMDGYEVMKALNKDLARDRIPVIVLTACGEEGRKRAGRLGAHAYLTKPFEESFLLRELASIEEGGLDAGD